MNETFMQLMNQLLPGLLYILALVLIFYARVLVKTLLPKVTEWIGTNTTATQRKTIADLGHEAFTYAETVYREKNGADKLNEALAYFQKHMDKYGLSNLTVDVIRAAIERAWLADKRGELLPIIEVGEIERPAEITE